jgi:hypothetical protein
VVVGGEVEGQGPPPLQAGGAGGAEGQQGAGGAALIQGGGQPAGTLTAGQARGPLIHRLEMAAVGHGPAHPEGKTEPALPPDGLKRGQGRVQPQALAERQSVVEGQA